MLTESIFMYILLQHKGILHKSWTNIGLTLKPLIDHLGTERGETS